MQIFGSTSGTFSFIEFGIFSISLSYEDFIQYIRGMLISLKDEIDNFFTHLLLHKFKNKIMCVFEF